MDYGKILTRAGQLVWRNKVLWILGLLASCAGGGVGGSGGSFNLPGGNTGNSSATDINERMLQDIGQWFQNNLQTVIGIGIALLCVLIVIGLITWVIGILGRGALIVAVDQLEAGEPTSFRAAWRGSTQYFRRLWGMNALLALPLWIAGLIILAFVGLSGYQLIQNAAAISSTGGLPSSVSSALLGGLCVGAPLICGMVIYSIFADILRVFGERAIMLEDRAVMDGLKTGWALFRRNLSDAFVLGLLWWVITFVVGMIILFVTFTIALPMGVGTAVAASQTGLGAATIGLATCGAVIIGVIIAIINSIFTAFSSTLWTLAYKAMSHKL